MTRFFIPMIFLACNSYAAGIQKWTDESGNVHYGDTPPAKTKTQSINVSRPPSNPGKPLPRLNAKKDEKKSSTDPTEQKESEKSSSAEANKKVCEKAKRDIDVILNNNVIRMKQSDGTERILTDEEIDERRLKLEQEVKQYCN